MREDALTDTELDAALAAADKELLEYVKGCARPHTALVVMMGSKGSAIDRTRRGGGTSSSPAAFGSTATRAAVIIEMRSIARRLSDSLARARAVGGVVALALYAALALPRQLNRCYPLSGKQDDAGRWLTEVDSVCSAWFAARSEHGAGRRPPRLASAMTATCPAPDYDHDAAIEARATGQPDDLVMGQPGPCALDWLLDRAKGPVTYLAGRLDHVDLDTLASELAAVCEQANDLAALASVCLSGTDISAKFAELVGTLGCLREEGSRLVRALPRVHCMAVELRELAARDAVVRVGQLGSDCQITVLYQLNYLTETVMAAQHDAETVMTAIDTAVHQLSGPLLSKVEIDASGADLSAVRIDDLTVLDGVLRTRETHWPPGTSQRVWARSCKIGSGRYRVGNGNADDHFNLNRLVTPRL